MLNSSDSAARLNTPPPTIPDHDAGLPYSNRDPLIRQAITDNHHATDRTIIEEAFHFTSTLGQELCFSNREDTQWIPIVKTITLLEPEQHESKSKALWDIQLAKLKRDGYNLIYTDGSRRDSHIAAGVGLPLTKERTGEYRGISS